MDRSVDAAEAPIRAASAFHSVRAVTYRAASYPGRMNRLGFIALCSLTAMILTLYFFSPRFVIWRALDYSFGWYNPEVNRAVFSLQKVEKPFEFTTNNAPINWRFLFPLIAHYLHFPRWAFLAIPFVGCWVTLAAVCHITLRDTGSRWTASLLTVIVATSSWFFVSTGWLAYFDSWYILGILAFVFYRSYWIVGATCLLSPWVDERFVFMLPMLFVCRGIYYDWIPRRDWRDYLICSLLALLFSGSYVGIRLVAHFGGYESATTHNLNEHLAGFESHYLKNIGIGIWNGLRGGWLLAIVFLGYLWKRTNYLVGAVLAAISLTNIFMMIRVVQGDHSRTASVAVPMLMLGALFLIRDAKQQGNRVLLGIAAFNLLCPAYHVITTFTVPIRYFYAEYDRYYDPPVFLQPMLYMQRGLQLIQQKQLDEAIQEFDIVLQLDPAHKEARVHKAIIYLNTKRYDEGIAELNEAVAVEPDFPEAYLARGACREEKAEGGRHPNEFKLAVTDYKKALDSPNKDWPQRAEAERRFKRLRSIGFSPIE